MALQTELIRTNWTKDDYSEFRKYLYSQQDLEYRKFHSSLVPGIGEHYDFIGIRMPILRELGKYISKGNWHSFLAVIPSPDYELTYEERTIKGIVIGLAKVDYNEFLSLIDSFLPSIDNWAICDCFCSGLKQVRKYKDQFLTVALEYCKSSNPWIVRAGLVIILFHLIEEDTLNIIFALADSINSEEYYVNMAVAWLLSMCYVKYPNKTLEYFENNTTLCDFTYNKALQKTRESLRVSSSDKEYLNTLKRR